MPSTSQQLDNQIEIVTPENIAFRYRVAGPFRRLMAYLIDLAIQVAVVFIAAMVLLIAFGTVGLVGIGFFGVLIIYFLLNWFYGGMFETYWNGQTIGKRAMRIRVLSDNGQPINGLQAVARNFFRLADSVPIIFTLFPIPTYQVGLLIMSCNHRFQRLGDWATGTMVVIEEPQRLYGVARVDEPEAIRLASYLPTDFQVSRSLGRALNAYVQRRRSFPWKRRLEIAMHLAEPLRVKFGLPAGTNHDLLLCALYHRTFIADLPEQDEGASPFGPVPAAAVAAMSEG